MTVAEVARVLEPRNVADLLPRFFGLSKREAKVLVASLLPTEAPPLRELITPARAAPAVPALALALTTPSPPAPEAVEVAVLPVERDPSRATAPAEPPRPAVAPGPADTVEPLSRKLSRVHLTVEDAFLADYEAARAAVSHSHPNAGMAEILQLGLKALVERHAKRRGLVKRPRKTPRPSADPEYVPAHVSRAVWERDGGKCQWRLPSGEICGSTHRVQIDHITPRAAGGPSTVENCRLACAAHNDLAARRYFGDAWMDRYKGRRRSPRRGRTGAAASPGSGVAGRARTDPSGSSRRIPVEAPPMP
jgi:5-methylcytosine-specific restriction endonuclease McrA